MNNNEYHYQQFKIFNNKFKDDEWLTTIENETILSQNESYSTYSTASLCLQSGTPSSKDNSAFL